MDVRKTTELCIDVSRYTGMNLVNLYTIFLKRKHMNVHRSTQIYLNIYRYIYIYICDEISTNIEINMFCFLLVVTWTQATSFWGVNFFFLNRTRGLKKFFRSQKDMPGKTKVPCLCWDRRDRFVFPPRFCPVQTTMGRIKNKWWGCDFFHIKFFGGFRNRVPVLKDTHL